MAYLPGLALEVQKLAGTSTQAFANGMKGGHTCCPNRYYTSPSLSLISTIFPIFF
jgi:hypothetical protein